MGVYVTTLILLNTDLTSDEPNITKDDAALFRVLCTLFCVNVQSIELIYETNNRLQKGVAMVKERPKGLFTCSGNSCDGIKLGPVFIKSDYNVD